MKWFGGDIPTAIKLAKDNKAIFIVYISGKDFIMLCLQKWSKIVKH